MISIDGSYGEGGGQILRSALSLSCLYRKQFRIFNIRKGRKKPGLMPQHLTAVRAAQLLSNAEVKGDYTGSTELLFSPKEVKNGDFFFDIGTAGSTSLVLQTLIPSLVFSKEKSTIILKGGTHVPFSPSFHYLSEVFAPFLKKLGVEINLTLESYGFYPKGGGKIRAEIFPAKDIKSLNILERGRLIELSGYSAVGNLPLSIAERQKNALIQTLMNHALKPFLEKGDKMRFDIELLDVQTPGQGTFVFLKSEFEYSIAGFSSLGERGKKAEKVGEETAHEFLRYFSANSALDPHIADQIVLYLSLGKGRSIFSTSCITHHLMTNLWVIKLFHDYSYSIEGNLGNSGIVTIN